MNMKACCKLYLLVLVANFKADYSQTFEITRNDSQVMLSRNDRTNKKATDRDLANGKWLKLLQMQDIKTDTEIYPLLSILSQKNVGPFGTSHGMKMNPDPDDYYYDQNLNGHSSTDSLMSIIQTAYGSTGVDDDDIVKFLHRKNPGRLIEDDVPTTLPSMVPLKPPAIEKANSISKLAPEEEPRSRCPGTLTQQPMMTKLCYGLFSIIVLYFCNN